MTKFVYELNFWLGLDADIEKEDEKISGVIKGFGAEIVQKTLPKKKRLAYPILKQTLGSYSLIVFKFGDNENKIKAIEKELRLNKNILRLATFRKKESLLTKEKLERPEKQFERGNNVAGQSG
ncbi:MAG: 30S ribosomal protein S6 [Patescibacteria group bacterium]|nr:30S ribosomal protein S6 [Patescibacteria group bacterium]MCL5257689.1 30S ribosomal protein S6 [Patescibacteria group bacterium]